MDGFPQFIAFGEALTDMIRSGANRWASVPGGAPWNVARVMATSSVVSAFGGAISQDCFGNMLWQASAEAGLAKCFMRRLNKFPLLAIVNERLSIK